MMRFISLLTVLCLATAGRAEDLLATGITRPSEELSLNFRQQGLIKDVKVKEGDHVKTGDLLVQQLNTIEAKRLEALEVEAGSELAIEAQILDMEYKRIIMNRKKKMLDGGLTASLGEYEQAVLEFELADKRVDIARQELATKRIERDQQTALLDQMKIVAPRDGVIARVNVGQGEMADPQREGGAVLLVVRNPLWVEIRDLSRSQTRQLKVGQTLEVRYDDQSTWKPAKLIFLSEVDPASDTQAFRLEMANDDDQVSGERVQVKLPATVAGGQ